MRKATTFWLTSAAVLLLLISVETNVRAATFTVNNIGDAPDINIGDGICSTSAVTNVCTLRAAVQEAEFTTVSDTVDFAAALNNQTITLVNGELLITTNITISGPGARLLTISANNATRHFINDVNGSLIISNLTLTQGTDGTNTGGGSILNQGSLIITRATISGNSTNGGGGGIFTQGTLQIRDSTISGNNSGIGGGIYISSTNQTTIYNSTISGNTTTESGGGILKINSGSLILVNATIANNTVTNGNGGGLSGDGGLVNPGNTLIAANTDTAGGNAPDVFGNVFLSSGYNLIGDASGSTGFTNGVNGDQVGSAASPINPQISPLQFSANGQTQTHVLLFGSPAIDAGLDALTTGVFITLDQRNLPRFIDGFAGLSNDALGTVDIGAVEAQTTTAASVLIGGRVMNPSGRGIYGARILMTTPLGEVRFATTNPFGYYRFDGVQVGATYIFEVSAKRYTFTPQAVKVTEQLDDLNFTALP